MARPSSSRIPARPYDPESALSKNWSVDCTLGASRFRRRVNAIPSRSANVAQRHPVLSRGCPRPRRLRRSITAGTGRFHSPQWNTTRAHDVLQQHKRPDNDSRRHLRPASQLDGFAVCEAVQHYLHVVGNHEDRDLTFPPHAVLPDRRLPLFPRLHPTTADLDLPVPRVAPCSRCRANGVNAIPVDQLAQRHVTRLCPADDQGRSARDALSL